MNTLEKNASFPTRDPAGQEHGATAGPANRGFTLIEVMVSVAILAIGLFGLLSLQNQTISLSQASKNLTLASLIAKEAYTEKELELRGLVGITERTGKMIDSYPGFRLEEPDVIPLELPLGDVPPVPLSLITVVVKWEEGGSERSFSLTGVVAPGVYGESGQ